jgi:hypothetical protein
MGCQRRWWDEPSVETRRSDRVLPIEKTGDSTKDNFTGNRCVHSA